ncbi:hypothetical protein [Streptosporangium lutulentum]|uniref:Uncharacterized protein n=1 Tax=Streptosporangium lutulentum TaxID=1461250 RepID=A0ABT9QMT6_9ACTN|nr:hypothetical protein [Streptosporangium lutulentum]MDP9848072.1 hypothetical protein [Streptosporangium lutulentum]
MTPSRKPSRATVITASVAIGVFGAGAGLGTVIAIRSNPIEDQVIRLAAGTYHLDDRAGAWTSQAAAGGDQPVPLSGADAGSTITKESDEQRVCLTATVDGRAVGAGGSGCAALPVLAVAAAAVETLQRPGNPKSTPTQPPPKTSSAPKPATPKTTAPKTPVRPPAAAPAPAPKAPARPPAAAPKAPPKAPPAPTPTQKITGNVSENGSVVRRVPDAPAYVTLDPLPTPPETRPSRNARTAQPPALKPALPSDGLRPTTPSERNRTTPPQRSGDPVVPPGSGARKPTVPPRPSGTAKPTRPSGQLRPALPPVLPRPSDTSSRPDPTLAPTGPAERAKPPSADPGNPPQAPDGTAPAPQPIPEGEAQLPVFRDPELLRQAREALGLDRGMRYTDENGVWDLNIAPPGTPPCRDYSLEELQALGTSPSASGAVQNEQGTAVSPTVPRDSCLWPAFIRWLYAEPEPGEVSNWTKVTGLLKRNLELVLTNPAPAPSAPIGRPSIQPDPARPDTVEPDAGRPDTVEPDTGQTGQSTPRRIDPGQIDRPDTVQPNQPDQPGRVDQPDSSRYDRFDQPRRSGQPGRVDSVRPGPGQIEPDPDEYTGP